MVAWLLALVGVCSSSLLMRLAVSDLQCSHNGVLSHGSGRCRCDPPWSGSNCGQLPRPPKLNANVGHETSAAFYRRVLGGSAVVAECKQLADCTDSLNHALNHTGRVVVPPLYDDKGDSVPWRVRGFNFRAHDARVIFASGVQVEALRNDTFLYACDPVADLAGAHNLRNLTVTGYGATWRMWREDYVRRCKHSEFRMGWSIDNCTDVQVAGLTIRETGGDGLIVMSSVWNCLEKNHNGVCTKGLYRKQGATQNLLVRDVVLDKNYRQGMSVISAQNAEFINCTFSNTNGTAPEAGVDLEPDPSDVPSDPLRLTNITFRDCVSVNNSGAGFAGYFAGLLGNVKGGWAKGVPPTTVKFVNCSVRGGNSSGWNWGCLYPELAGELVVSGGSTEGTKEWGVHISNKARSSLPIRFEGHVFRDVATGAINVPCDAVAKKKGECLPNLILNPINLGTRYGMTPEAEGTVAFSNCTIWDSRPRPWFQLIGDEKTAWSNVNLTSNVVHTASKGFCSLNISGGANDVDTSGTTCTSNVAGTDFMTAGIALSPPYRVSTLTPVEVWAAVPSTCKRHSGCELHITLSATQKTDASHIFPISVPAGQRSFARLHVASLNLSTWEGALTIHASIMLQHDRSGSFSSASPIAERTWPYEVVRTGVRSTRLIDGAFVDIVHWSAHEALPYNEALREMTSTQWAGQIADMAEAGIRTATLQSLFINDAYSTDHCTCDGYPGVALYPSEVYPRNKANYSRAGNGVINASAATNFSDPGDKVETILSAADAHNVSVYIGLGSFAWFVFDAEALCWSKRVAKEIWSMYGHHRSFYGFYIGSSPTIHSSKPWL